MLLWAIVDLLHCCSPDNIPPLVGIFQHPICLDKFIENMNELDDDKPKRRFGNENLWEKNEINWNILVLCTHITFCSIH
jgi:hypothetical protein